MRGAFPPLLAGLRISDISWLCNHDLTLMDERLNRITLPSGISLEVSIAQPSYDEPTDGPTESKLAICLHPWSWLGGQKDDQ